MTTSRTFLARFRRGDDGSALVLTMLVLAVMTGLGLTVFTLATDNLDNSRRDRQATSALANAEAGVAQATAYIKNRGTGRLACAPNCGAANPWGEEPGFVEAVDDGHPSTQVTLASGETYSVWIETVQQVNVVANTTGLYRIHSVGNSGTGPGARTVEVDVEVAPFKFPLAVFADSVQAGGSGSIQTESLFSTGCIFKRSKITFVGNDPVYGIPAAAHSEQYITDSQAAGSACAATDDKNIHAPSGSTAKPCNTNYPYDQDRQGGPLAGTSCLGDGGAYPQTSKIDSLAAQYGFQSEGLTAPQLDQLRTAAKGQGFYFTNTTAIPAVLTGASTSLAHPNPVLFYDLQGGAVGELVDLNDLSESTYGRATSLAATSASCTGRSVIVVVVNGNVKLNSNQTLVGSVFAMGPAPYGEVRKANGTSRLIGTMYAKSLDLTGTADVNLDDCFLQNLPGQLLNVTPTTFREVDR